MQPVSVSEASACPRKLFAIVAFKDDLEVQLLKAIDGCQFNMSVPCVLGSTLDAPHLHPLRILNFWREHLVHSKGCSTWKITYMHRHEKLPIILSIMVRLLDTDQSTDIEG